VSGIQVRYLKIVEKSGYQALPWVRYVASLADFSGISPCELTIFVFFFSFHDNRYITQASLLYLNFDS
jgi:hypothetical protein